MSRRAQFLEVLGIPTEWVPRKPVGAPQEAAAQPDRSAALQVGPEAQAEPLQAPEPGEGSSAVVMESVPDFEEAALAFVAEPERTAAVPDRELDIAAMAWPALDAAVAACTACGLCETRTRTVFGVGDRQAEWMLIGEAPGENEDLQGEPFVGQAGKLLDNMLGSLGLARGRNVFIANVLKCRPPGNRNPEAAEVVQCEPFLKRQIALVRPKVIVVLGRFAAQSLLRTTTPIGKLRGTVHSYEGIPVVVTYHPAYLLRTLTDKARAWEDLCLAREIHDRAGAQA